jgi:hypothetical protein
MRVNIRSLSAVFLAIFAAIGLTISWGMTTAVQLQAATALVMGGTGHPLSGRDSPGFIGSYLDGAVRRYINPGISSGSMGEQELVTNAVAVVTPEEFFPVSGLMTFERSVADGRANVHRCLTGVGCDHNGGAYTPPGAADPMAIFGYSQSAVIASLVKQDLINAYKPGDPSRMFNLIANPMRPNGGIMMWGNGIPTIPIMGIPFYGAAPNNGPVGPGGAFVYPTIDVVQQYDALGGDFPPRFLNWLATINAFAGYLLLHGNVVDKPLSDAKYQDTVGDTTYYMFPTDILPILMPLQQIGIPKALLKLIDAPMRVLIEDAYVRNLSPGVPVGLSILPVGNPIAVVINLLRSIPVGFDDMMQGFGLGRPLGTTPAGPFGVGGPSLPKPPPPAINALDGPAAAGAVDTAETSRLSQPVELNARRSVKSAVPEAESPISGSPVETELAPQAAEISAGTTEEQAEVRAELQPQVTGGETAQNGVENTETTVKPVEPVGNPGVKRKLSATDPDRPKVRGPIQFEGPNGSDVPSSPGKPSGQASEGEKPDGSADDPVAGGDATGAQNTDTTGDGRDDAAAADQKDAA